MVQHITDDVLVMRHGHAVEQGPTRQVLTDPAHPYTRLLLAAVPGEGWDRDTAVTARKALAGTGD